jgi:hypothetical protein
VSGRDEIIKKVLSNGVGVEDFIEENLEIIRHNIIYYNIQEENIKQKILMEFDNNLKDFIKILKKTWKIHNSLSLEEISIVKFLEKYGEDTINIPYFSKNLYKIIKIHDMLDIIVYLLSPLLKPIINSTIDKLKATYNLQQNEVFALSTPINDSFYIKRFEGLMNVTFLEPHQRENFIKSLVEELYGGSYELFKRDLNKFINRIDVSKSYKYYKFLRKEEIKKTLIIEKYKLKNKIGDIVDTIDDALSFDNTEEYIYFRSSLFGIEDFYLRKLVLKLLKEDDLRNVYNIKNHADKIMERLKYKIPKYRQNYVCFSACLVNALWHFKKNLGSLRNLELEITKKTTAWPYLFILMPKLGEIAINYGLSASLIQTKREIPNYFEAKKEYDRWGMKFYKIENLNKNGILFKEEDITEENYEYIKELYSESLSNSISKGMGFKVVSEINPTMLLDKLERGNLSIWVIMLGKYGHSNLLYGYDKKNRFFYFFDPIYGGRLVKFSDIDKYLEAPIMKMGIFIGPKVEETYKKVENIVDDSISFLNKIKKEHKVFKLLFSTLNYENE